MRLVLLCQVPLHFQPPRHLQGVSGLPHDHRPSLHHGGHRRQALGPRVLEGFLRPAHQPRGSAVV